MWLEEGEIRAMAGVLSMTEAAFVARFVRQVVDPDSGVLRSTLREASDGDAGDRCALLTGANACSVYTARPAQCRTFPFWPRVLADRDAFESARATCRGIAVVVPEATRRRAFALLEALYADADAVCGEERTAIVEREGCCLDGADCGQIFVTGLEADHATASPALDAWPDPHAGREPLGHERPRAEDRRVALDRAAPTSPIPQSRCALRSAPLACRTRGSDSHAEAFLERLRTIERDVGYPPAYGPLHEMLRVRWSQSEEAS